MDIKVLYYVDNDDNTKGSLIAFPSNKDLRNEETIKKIGEVLHAHGFGEKMGICNSVAWELAHHGKAELTCMMGEYSFSFEEVEFLP